SGTPTIVSGSEGTHQFVITMSDSEAVTSLPSSLLKGNYVEANLSQTGNATKFLLAEKTFKAFTGSHPIAANQCWLECDLAQASEIIAEFNAPTGIQGTLNSQQQSSTIYSVAGKRLSAPQRGINIIDQKKVLVK
ncbi:MAG: hypothetical protein IKT92_00965, partial [Bacteroidaceae bacterium]|nr:hypothetical protein [Bacteroidaceae bacterium]